MWQALKPTFATLLFPLTLERRTAMVFLWSILAGMAAADEAAEKPSLEFEA